MSWRVADCLAELRAEVNTRWPNRDKRSDGSIGDEKHRKSKSDHNPNAAGVVRAIDIDVDGITADWLAEHLRKLGSGGDARLQGGGYVIFNHRIASDVGGWKWRTYNGRNPHTSHIHVSAAEASSAYDASGGWGVTAAPKVTRQLAKTGGGSEPTHRAGSRVLKLTDPWTRGADVRDLQRWLGCRADGVFGLETEAAVRRWQEQSGITADGICGPQTWATLRR